MQPSESGSLAKLAAHPLY